MQKQLDSVKTWYSGFFEVADYESELEIKNFWMSDPILPIKMQKWLDLNETLLYDYELGNSKRSVSK